MLFLVVCVLFLPRVALSFDTEDFAIEDFDTEDYEIEDFDTEDYDVEDFDTEDYDNENSDAEDYDNEHFYTKDSNTEDDLIEERIINGYATKTDRKYFVHIDAYFKVASDDTDQKLIESCGGTIIAPHFVLTTSRCLEGDLDSVWVYHAIHGPGRNIYKEPLVNTRMKINSHVKAGYDSDGNYIDLALLYIRAYFDLARALPICDKKIIDEPIKNPLLAFGYGLNDKLHFLNFPTKLRLTHFNHTSHSSFPVYLLESIVEKIEDWSSTHLRLHTKAKKGYLCTFDSGSPLVTYDGNAGRNCMIGVLSGDRALPNRHCSENSKHWWTNAFKLNSWIEEQMGVLIKKEQMCTHVTDK